MRYAAGVKRYWAIVALGSLIAIGLGVVFILGVIEARNPGTFPEFKGVQGGTLSFGIIGVIVAAWGAVQLRKPAPIV